MRLALLLLERVAAQPTAMVSDHMTIVLNPKVKLLSGPQKPLRRHKLCHRSPPSSEAERCVRSRPPGAKQAMDKNYLAFVMPYSLLVWILTWLDWKLQNWKVFCSTYSEGYLTHAAAD